MLKKYINNKIILTESLIIILSIIWFLMIKNDQLVSRNIIINLTFLALFATMFIFRNSNHRHLLFAFIFLMSSVVADTFGLNNMLFLTSSLTLSLLILGGLNLLIFQDRKHDD